MDINESSFSRYKTNKPGISRSTSETKAAASSRVSSTPNTVVQNSKSADFKEGQIIKGQIIDHRYNEVQIQLEPSNQIVKAKLSGNVPLSIGQEANFQVTGNSSEGLVLKYVPEKNTQSSDVLIQRALTASNLTMTDKNKAIVQELLSHNMPIDKQTLQLLVKLSYSNREASPLTLVLMQKNNIPMTPENIRQFEAYQNGTHQILNDIKTIAGNLTKLITQQGDLQATNAPFTNWSAQTMSDGIGNESPVLAGTNQADSPTNTVVKNESVNNAVPLTQDPHQASVTSQSPSAAISNPSNVLTNSYNAINKLIQISGKLIEELTIDEITTQQLPNENSAATALLTQDHAWTDASSLQSNSVISQQLINTNSTAVLSDFLNPAERAALMNYMDTFPDPEGMKEQIKNGAAPLNKVLSFILENLPQSGKDIAGKLLGSAEYTKLLENAFLQKWTITPDKLSKKTPISELYQNLQTDMEELSHLIKAGGNTSEAMKLQEPVKNLQENLQFMKDLNEAFTYIQLPVRLKDKQLHTDLYVFSRKKALQEKPDNISVLLHLDMDHLGPLNVHISLYEKTILAKFYMVDSEAEQLVTTNMTSLSQVLEKKGYQLSSEVVCNYQQPDFSRDFIEDNLGDGDVKRYTFDIRT